MSISARYSIIILVLMNLFVFAQPRETKSFDFNDFSKVSASHGMRLSIVQSNDFAVEIEADKEDFKYLCMDNNKGKLRFYIDANNYRTKGKIEIKISMPELNDITLSGGATGNIQTDIKSSHFNGKLSGGAQLNGNLVCGNLKLELTGGSKIKLEGKGKDANIKGAGGSSFELKDFSVNKVDVDLSGGCKMKITMNGQLNTSQSGGSNLTYYGIARMGKMNFSSGSKIINGN